MVSDLQKAAFFDALIEAGVIDTDVYQTAKDIYLRKQAEVASLG